MHLFFFVRVLHDLFYLYYSLRSVITMKSTMHKKVYAYTGLKFSWVC